MYPELPSFDELKKLAEKDPKEFEALRKELCEKTIESSASSMQKRLRGLQFQIDMERRRAKTPMASCIKISKMMHDSLHELQNILTGPMDQIQSSPNQTSDTQGFDQTAKVIPFREQKAVS